MSPVESGPVRMLTHGGSEASGNCLNAQVTDTA